MRGARIINVAPLSGFPRERGDLWGELGGLGSSFLVGETFGGVGGPGVIFPSCWAGQGLSQGSPSDMWGGWLGENKMK